MSLEFNGSATGNHCKALSKGVVHVFKRALWLSYGRGVRRRGKHRHLVRHEGNLGMDGFGDDGAQWAELCPPQNSCVEVPHNVAV